MLITKLSVGDVAFCPLAALFEDKNEDVWINTTFDCTPDRTPRFCVWIMRTQRGIDVRVSEPMLHKLYALRNPTSTDLPVRIRLS